MRKQSKFYITTPIYYVNAAPHIGHSYTSIAADTLARCMRRELGEDKVWFLTGTDEHGQKIQKAADEAHQTPQEFVDAVVVKFRGLWESLNISNNDFIRTTQERHIVTLRRALELLYRSGDIYRDTYQGWYCTPCETFWTEGQLTDQSCPDCKRPVERIAETNYFFRISKYQPWLIEYIESHPDFIRPVIRRNEVLSFLKLNTLTDLCISRPKERLNWGVQIPFAPDHVTYVWFDALINYISAVGSFDAHGVYHSPWWDEQTFILHLIGKDILRQHTVYWPIMLKALGIRIPDAVFAHGWWMIDQNKMSKSRGNAVDPLEMVDKFGIDVYRYFLMRDVPFGLDGNFSEEAIIRRFNADLANDIGNLVYRTLTMVEKYYAGAVPDVDIITAAYDASGEALKARLKSFGPEVAAALTAGADFNFSAALDAVWSVVNGANKYVEETKPWNLAKENRAEDLRKFVRILVESIRACAGALAPFMPQTAASILEQVGENTVRKGAPLFPRIEVSK